VLPIRGQELRTRLIPLEQQRFEHLAGDREDVAEIDDSVFEFFSINVLGVEHARVPDVALTDVVAKSLPGLGGWVLTTTPLIFLPEPFEV
jgi:hypothetical protein